MTGSKKQDGVGGILSGIADVLEKLGELAEKGEQLKRSGSFESQDKTMSGMYGFSFKFGDGEKEESGPTFESFGNVKRDGEGSSYFDEVREPLTDVFEEDNAVVVVLEMPGIEKDDISLQFDDKKVTIEAQRGDKRYKKELLLAKQVGEDGHQLSCNNGIVELRCPI